jgi:hypothetical protein
LHPSLLVSKGWTKHNRRFFTNRGDSPLTVGRWSFSDHISENYTTAEQRKHTARKAPEALLMD